MLYRRLDPVSLKKKSLILPNPNRRIDSLPLLQLLPHNASDESADTSIFSHKSSIQDPHGPSTFPLRLNDI